VGVLNSRSPAGGLPARCLLGIFLPPFDPTFGASNSDPVPDHLAELRFQNRFGAAIAETRGDDGRADDVLAAARAVAPEVREPTEGLEPVVPADRAEQLDALIGERLVLDANR
jgi:hypothetical protein